MIPCFNQAQFLAEAVQSVLGQTYRNFELLVIDDGSTDDTATRARDLGVPCVSQENRGLSGARNRGIEETGGEFLVFLDADDRLLPHALEANLDAFEEYPGAAFVSGTLRLINSTGQPLRTLVPTPPAPQQDQYAELLKRNYVGAVCSVMFRRNQLIAAGGFDASLGAIEVHDLYLRLAREHQIYAHSVPIFEYRRHPNNMSRDYGLMLSSGLSVLRSQRAWARQNKLRREAYEAGIAEYRLFYGVPLAEDFAGALRRRDWSEAISAARVLAQHYPRGLVAPLRRPTTDRANTARMVEFE